MNVCRWNEVYRKNISNSLVLVVFHDQKLAAKLQDEASFFLFLFLFEILHVLRKCLLGPFPLIIDDCNAFNKIFDCFTPFLGCLKKFKFFDFLHVDCGGGVFTFLTFFFGFLTPTMRFITFGNVSHHFCFFGKNQIFNF